MIKKLVIAVCVLALPVVYSCGDKGGKKEGEIVAEYTLENKPGFTLRLFSEGNEPREVLDFKFKKGTEQTGKIVMGMNMQMTTNGKAAPAVKTPSIVTHVKTIVEEIDQSGTATVKYEIKEITVEDDPDVHPQMTKSLKDLYSKVKKITCSGKISPNGVLTKPECVTDGGLEPYLMDYLNETMRNFSNNMFLPREAVGVGAEWEILNPKMMAGSITVDFGAKYKLLSLNGDVAVIESTSKQTAGEQMVTFPGTTFETKIVSLNSSGAGKMDINFNELMPRGEMKGVTEVKSLMQLQNDQENEVVTKMDIDMRFTD